MSSSSGNTMFPMKVTVGDCSVILHSNGSFIGDIEGFTEAISSMSTSSSMGIVLWLLYRELRRDHCQ